MGRYVSKTKDDLGYLADKDGFQRVVLDLRAMIKKCRADIFGMAFPNYGVQHSAITSTSQRTFLGRDFTATHERAGLPVKYFP